MKKLVGVIQWIHIHVIKVQVGVSTGVSNPVPFGWVYETPATIGLVSECVMGCFDADTVPNQCKYTVTSANETLVLLSLARETNPVAVSYIAMSPHNEKSFHDELLNNDQESVTTNILTNITMLLCFWNGGGHCDVTSQCPILRQTNVQN